ncbi:MAG: hypothetical protein JOZ95_24725 [Solirubrobacterales bacterium]|nr:hypothetical protein [Solirubrobacterales bacterium]
MAEPNPNDRAAHEAAMQIFNSFLAASTPPDAAYVDPDPSTTHDPHPEVACIEEALQDLAPAQFGGIYRTKDGVVHVGIVGDTSAPRRAATAAAPNAKVEFFPANHIWGYLQAIADQLTKAMAGDPTAGLVSVRLDPETNRVDVGVSDPASPAAQSIMAQYGDAVSLAPDQPIEPLTSAYPDRNTSSREQLPGP